MLTADELLAGSSLTYDVEVPPDVLQSPQAGRARAQPGHVRLRPLTVHDLQLVARAAKESDTLIATLMVQRSLVEPEMSVAQVAALPVGLVHYLLDRVNGISGITATAEHLSEALDAPLAKAAYLLAREYGWTPQEVNDLTLGQVLLHLHMLKEQRQA